MQLVINATASTVDDSVTVADVEQLLLTRPRLGDRREHPACHPRSAAGRRRIDDRHVVVGRQPPRDGQPDDPATDHDHVVSHSTFTLPAPA